MLKQKQLATAVAAVLGASAAAIDSAGANTTVYFPFVVNSPTLSTVVSTLNGGPGITQASQEVLKYYYYFKPVTADHDDYCTKKSGPWPTSQYDIQTFDLGGQYGAGTRGVLFNDPSFNNNWDTGPVTNTFAVGANLAPHRGYLVVENGGSGSTEQIAGEAFIFETASGAAWGYQAFTSPFAANLADFTDFASANPNQVAIMPFDEITTKFTVTPLDDGAPYQVPEQNSLSSYVWLEVANPYNPGAVPDVMFDRDEIPWDGRNPKRVVCVAAVEARDLLADGVADSVPDGGWTNVYNSADNPLTATGTAAPDPNAILFKVEYGQGSFNNEPMNGIYNNSFYMHPATP